MSFKETRCFEVECDDCNDGWADSDYGTPHFAATDDLASKLAEWNWSVEDGQHYCAVCTDKRKCAREGHQPCAIPSWDDGHGRVYPGFTICDRCNERLSPALPLVAPGDQEGQQQ